LPRESQASRPLTAWYSHTLVALIALLFLWVGRAFAPESLTDRTAVGHAHAPAHRHGATRNRATAAAAVHVPSSTAKLLGQRIMVGVSGTSASSSLLAAVRRGEVGSVILFAANIVSRTQLASLISSLQDAAHAGGEPPLLIAVDQEGGQVKRLPAGPPTLSPPQMAATGNVSVASSQGRATGRYLHARGINWDLAPVVDVPTFKGAFVWQQGRAFSFNAGTVTSFATAFGLGVQSGGAAATAKHFPGLGTAPIDTDNKLQELHPTAAQRAAALKPYESLIKRGVDSVMVSDAGFPAYDRSGSVAALSKPIIQRLLRKRLGFSGVAITDSLETPTGHDEITAGVLAAEAGADVLLFTDSAPGELSSLETAYRHGHIRHADAVASYQRIVALKRKVA
jgi:beta-N-acetylhexosaminidase